MSKYGKAAVKAVNLFVSENMESPQEAWEKATCEIFDKGTSSQLKGCPKCAFLGLCEEGKVKGIPRGDYTKSKKNKGYAIKAVETLQKEPELISDQNSLWNRVISPEKKKHNQQMDVVIALWENKLII